jgi:hypothetical protein
MILGVFFYFLFLNKKNLTPLFNLFILNKFTVDTGVGLDSLSPKPTKQQTPDVHKRRPKMGRDVPHKKFFSLRKLDPTPIPVSL